MHLLLWSDFVEILTNITQRNLTKMANLLCNPKSQKTQSQLQKKARRSADNLLRQLQLPPRKIEIEQPRVNQGKLEAKDDDEVELVTSDSISAVVYVPSLEYIRLQFWPSRTTSLTAHRHTGRFDVKMKMQSKNIRKISMDSKYCAEMLKNTKCFLVEWQEKLLMFGIPKDKVVVLWTDDKCKANVGELGMQVTPGARQIKRVYIYDGEEMLAGDHDHVKFRIIPSSGYIGEIPKLWMVLGSEASRFSL